MQRINPRGALIIARAWELDHRFTSVSYCGAKDLTSRGFTDEEAARVLDVPVEEIAEIRAFDEETLALINQSEKAINATLAEMGYKLTKKGRHFRLIDVKNDITLSTF